MDTEVGSNPNPHKSRHEGPKLISGGVIQDLLGRRATDGFWLGPWWSNRPHQSSAKSRASTCPCADPVGQWRFRLVSSGLPRLRPMEIVAVKQLRLRIPGAYFLFSYSQLALAYSPFCPASVPCHPRSCEWVDRILDGQTHRG